MEVEIQVQVEVEVRERSRLEVEVGVELEVQVAVEVEVEVEVVVGVEAKVEGESEGAVEGEHLVHPGLLVLARHQRGIRTMHHHQPRVTVGIYGHAVPVPVLQHQRRPWGWPMPRHPQAQGGETRPVPQAPNVHPLQLRAAGNRHLRGALRDFEGLEPGQVHEPQLPQRDGLRDGDGHQCAVRDLEGVQEPKVVGDGEVARAAPEAQPQDGEALQAGELRHEDVRLPADVHAQQLRLLVARQLPVRRVRAGGLPTAADRAEDVRQVLPEAPLLEHDVVVRDGVPERLGVGRDRDGLRRREAQRVQRLECDAGGDPQEGLAPQRDVPRGLDAEGAEVRGCAEEVAEAGEGRGRDGVAVGQVDGGEAGEGAGGGGRRGGGGGEGERAVGADAELAEGGGVGQGHGLDGLDACKQRAKGGQEAACAPEPLPQLPEPQPGSDAPLGVMRSRVQAAQRY